MAENMSDIAINSSGDDEKDALALLRLRNQFEQLEERICPNGCAKLVWENPYNANCSVCNFHYSANRPYGKRESDSPTTDFFPDLIED